MLPKVNVLPVFPIENRASYWVYSTMQPKLLVNHAGLSCLTSEIPVWIVVLWQWG